MEYKSYIDGMSVVERLIFSFFLLGLLWGTKLVKGWPWSEVVAFCIVGVITYFIGRESVVIFSELFLKRQRARGQKEGRDALLAGIREVCQDNPEIMERIDRVAEKQETGDLVSH